jgi:ATP-dependent Clp protease ATP-binding subunit ClpC
MMDHDIVEKFTTHLKNVLTRTLCFVVETQQKTIHPEHLLWALGTEKGSIGAEVLKKVRIKVEPLRDLVGASLKMPAHREPPKTALAPMLSENAKRAIEKAVLVASVYEHQYVGTEHLLSGLLQAEDHTIAEFFSRQAVDLKELRHHLSIVLKSVSKFPEVVNTITEPEASTVSTLPVPRDEREPEKRKTAALDFFGRDLTSDDMQKRLDPVIGRDAEIERVMEILCRRTKNNPLLLGDPGVGKTAIVEGLAKRIAADDVPAPLRDKRLVSLDLSMIVAGTMYRGEFEARMRQLVDEVRDHHEVILFVDEVHMLVGAGAASGSLDAAGILKPALARGEIRCIGATTTEEYKKHIETDTALERRFQPVRVDEPTEEASVEILRGIAPAFETYHGVRVTEEAIQAAVRLSVRYLPERHLPDKAIDLMDEAAAARRVRRPFRSTSDKRRATERELTAVQDQKRQAVAEENFARAMECKGKEQRLRQALEALSEATEQNEPTPIRASDIADVVTRTIHVPLTELATDERNWLVRLEQELATHVMGQEAAVKRVADAVRRAKTGVSNPTRPRASFLFLGPSGVGKTELARAMARVVFGDAHALIQLDMSEFSEAFTVSKLLGSPAGYVGYREHTKLTDQVKQRPYSIVLFDELEKAHRDVQNILLQLLETGELSDATGRKINFRNTMVVMTSNVGLERLEGTNLGFRGGEHRTTVTLDDLKDELEDRFRPELLHRMDAICLFDRLDRVSLEAIAKKQLGELAARLAEQGVRFTYDDNVPDAMAARAEKGKLRAREIRKIIQTEIEPVIADSLLKQHTGKSLHLVQEPKGFRLSLRRLPST